MAESERRIRRHPISKSNILANRYNYLCGVERDTSCSGRLIDFKRRPLGASMIVQAISQEPTIDVARDLEMIDIPFETDIAVFARGDAPARIVS